MNEDPDSARMPGSTNTKRGRERGRGRRRSRGVNSSSQQGILQQAAVLPSIIESPSRNIGGISQGQSQNPRYRRILQGPRPISSFKVSETNALQAGPQLHYQPQMPEPLMFIRPPVSPFRQVTSGGQQSLQMPRFPDQQSVLVQQLPGQQLLQASRLPGQQSDQTISLPTQSKLEPRLQGQQSVQPPGQLLLQEPGLAGQQSLESCVLQNPLSNFSGAQQGEVKRTPRKQRKQNTKTQEKRQTEHQQIKVTKAEPKIQQPHTENKLGTFSGMHRSFHSSRHSGIHKNSRTQELGTPGQSPGAEVHDLQIPGCSQGPGFQQGLEYRQSSRYAQFVPQVGLIQNQNTPGYPYTPYTGIIQNNQVTGYSAINQTGFVHDQNMTSIQQSQYSTQQQQLVYTLYAPHVEGSSGIQQSFQPSVPNPCVMKPLPAPSRTQQSYGVQNSVASNSFIQTPAQSQQRQGYRGHQIGFEVSNRSGNSIIHYPVPRYACVQPFTYDGNLLLHTHPPSQFEQQYLPPVTSNVHMGYQLTQIPSQPSYTQSLEGNVQTSNEASPHSPDLLETSGADKVPISSKMNMESIVQGSAQKICDISREISEGQTNASATELSENAQHNNSETRINSSQVDHGNVERFIIHDDSDEEHRLIIDEGSTTELTESEEEQNNDGAENNQCQIRQGPKGNPYDTASTESKLTVYQNKKGKDAKRYNQIIGEGSTTESAESEKDHNNDRAKKKQCQISQEPNGNSSDSSDTASMENKDTVYQNIEGKGTQRYNLIIDEGNTTESAESEKDQNNYGAKKNQCQISQEPKGNSSDTASIESKDTVYQNNQGKGIKRYNLIIDEGNTTEKAENEKIESCDIHENDQRQTKRGCREMHFDSKSTITIEQKYEYEYIEKCTPMVDILQEKEATSESIEGQAEVKCDTPKTSTKTEMSFSMVSQHEDMLYMNKGSEKEEEINASRDKEENSDNTVSAYCTTHLEKGSCLECHHSETHPDPNTGKFSSVLEIKETVAETVVTVQKANKQSKEILKSTVEQKNNCADLIPTVQKASLMKKRLRFKKPLTVLFEYNKAEDEEKSSCPQFLDQQPSTSDGLKSIHGRRKPSADTVLSQERHAKLTVSEFKKTYVETPMGVLMKQKSRRTIAEYKEIGFTILGKDKLENNEDLFNQILALPIPDSKKTLSELLPAPNLDIHKRGINIYECKIAIDPSRCTKKNNSSGLPSPYEPSLSTATHSGKIIGDSHKELGEKLLAYLNNKQQQKSPNTISEVNRDSSPYKKPQKKKYSTNLHRRRSLPEGKDKENLRNAPMTSEDKLDIKKKPPSDVEMDSELNDAVSLVEKISSNSEASTSQVPSKQSFHTLKEIHSDLYKHLANDVSTSGGQMYDNGEWIETLVDNSQSSNAIRQEDISHFLANKTRTSIQTRNMNVSEQIRSSVEVIKQSNANFPLNFAPVSGYLDGISGVIDNSTHTRKPIRKKTSQVEKVTQNVTESRSNGKASASIEEDNISKAVVNGRNQNEYSYAQKENTQCIQEQLFSGVACSDLSHDIPLDFSRHSEQHERMLSRKQSSYASKETGEEYGSVQKYNTNALSENTTDGECHSGNLFPPPINSGTHLYEWFVKCHTEKYPPFLPEEDESHYKGIPSEPPPSVPYLLVCPMSLYPSSKPCPWLGYLASRDRHVETCHRQVLFTGPIATLGVNHLCILRVYQELFLVYTKYEEEFLYCMVHHDCTSHPCFANFKYTCVLTDSRTSTERVAHSEVATMFQTYFYLREMRRCVFYKNLNLSDLQSEDVKIHFEIYPYSDP